MIFGRKPNRNTSQYGELCAMRREIDLKDEQLRAYMEENRELRRRLRAYEPSINPESSIIPVEEPFETWYEEFQPVEPAPAAANYEDDDSFHIVVDGDGTVHEKSSVRKRSEEPPKPLVVPLCSETNGSNPLMDRLERESL